MPPKLSENCASLIRRMITVDPEERITAGEALEHPWIKNRGGSKLKESIKSNDVKLDVNVIKGL